MIECSDGIYIDHIFLAYIVSISNLIELNISEKRCILEIHKNGLIIAKKNDFANPYVFLLEKGSFSEQLFHKLIVTDKIPIFECLISENSYLLVVNDNGMYERKIKKL